MLKSTKKAENVLPVTFNQFSSLTFYQFYFSSGNNLQGYNLIEYVVYNYGHRLRKCSLLEMLEELIEKKPQ